MSAPVRLGKLARNGLTSTASRLSHQSNSMRNRPYTSADSSPPPFTYFIAASSVAKSSPPTPPRLGENFWTFSSTIVNPSSPYLRSTKKQSGEDAFFATRIGGSPNDVAIGLADGVGGWQDSGVDPSFFSQGLCQDMVETAHAHKGRPEELRAQPLLQKAYEAVIANARIPAGGSTASLAVLNASGSMEAANVGDSGYLIFGPGKVAFRSAAQTHEFNTPYQLSKIPKRMRQQSAIFGGSTFFSETPAQADVENHRLKHGDLVLFATDGVWDNLSAEDTLKIVTRIMEEEGFWFKSHNFAGAETLLNDTIRRISKEKEGMGRDEYLVGKIASAVMREAKLAGLDRKRNSPFARQVKKYYPEEGWSGGKPDDIAVIVCIAIQEGQNTQPPESQIKAKL